VLRPEEPRASDGVARRFLALTDDSDPPRAVGPVAPSQPLERHTLRPVQRPKAAHPLDVVDGLGARPPCRSDRQCRPRVARRRRHRLEERATRRVRQRRHQRQPGRSCSVDHQRHNGALTTTAASACSPTISLTPRRLNTRLRNQPRRGDARRPVRVDRPTTTGAVRQEAQRERRATRRRDGERAEPRSGRRECKRKRAERSAPEAVDGNYGGAWLSLSPRRRGPPRSQTPLARAELRRPACAPSSLISARTSDLWQSPSHFRRRPTDFGGARRI
jgi:hypothetical protein